MPDSQLDAVFGALADPTRRAILARLAEGDASVLELKAPFNVSQPAISKAIANLERTLGKRLFERSRRGIELSPYGNAMLKCGVAVFDDIRKGVEEIEVIEGAELGSIAAPDA